MRENNRLTGLLAVFLILSCSNTKNYYDYGSENAGIYLTDTPAAAKPAPDTPDDEIITPAPAMVLYEGELLNIFFHTVIAWPEIAFTGKMKQTFLEWYVSADEFRRILNELYNDNYALINIGEFYEVNYINGVKKVTAKKLLVPEGKKPMVISIDDLCYYEHVRQNGSVHKLVIDENGEIAAWTDNAGRGELSYDLDIITIMEDFIRQHPDFSVRGAKGIIAVTGYEGLLGYKTEELDAPGYSKEVEGVTAVIKKLKELGWRFASHSWGHLNMPKVPMSWFTYDLKLWDRQVRPILGDTDLYIYPFGAGVEAQEDKHKILLTLNYNLFFGVGSGFGHSECGGYIYIDRRNIDGFYFRIFKNRNDKLFDIDKVIDKRFR
ncbi:MAG: hypothetical protein LBH43_15180 [Treponema sp.]|jgi:hypothetical protein|nr:hypothetical protein [Treponema sp.]